MDAVTFDVTPGPLTFPSMVEAQAYKTPDALAIVDGEEETTYREVRLQMNRVANFLLQRGVRPGRRVGLYMRRGESVGESLQLILGILRVAGYVPLDTDPEFPSSRLAV